jgi:hypothetical protein
MKRILVIFSLILGFHSFAQTKLQILDFDLTIDQLSELRMKSDLNTFQIHPSLEMTLEELNDLQIQKVLRQSEVIEIGYDLTLDELSELSISKNTNIIQPDYNASLNTLSKLSLKKGYLIDNQINVSFGLSIETLIKLSLVD